jgi:uncharacterized protein (DUF2132 family)
MQFNHNLNRAILKPMPNPSPKQPNNPLHGITLETILTALVSHYSWAELALRIPVRCFSNDPSIASSLKFLRKTPWARNKVENLYMLMLREINRVDAKSSNTDLHKLNQSE